MPPVLGTRARAVDLGRGKGSLPSEAKQSSGRGKNDVHTHRSSEVSRSSSCWCLLQGFEWGNPGQGAAGELEKG